MAGVIGSHPKVACPYQSSHLPILSLILGWKSALPDL